MKLHLRLLGPIHIDQIRKNPNNELKESDTRSVPRFRSRRTVALLGYLAVEQRPVTRAFLAALFWPDEIPSKSRANLRRELHNLGQILPDCWVLAHQSVAFVPSDETTVDLFTLSVLAAEERWDEAALLIEGESLLLNIF